MDMGKNFRLTGSRSYGTARDDSDWDFFAADSPALRESLEAQGFNLLHRQIAPGANVQAVYHSVRLNCHVQLVADLAEREMMDRALLESPHVLSLLKSKDDMRRLWVFATSLYRMTKREYDVRQN